MNDRNVMLTAEDVLKLTECLNDVGGGSIKVGIHAGRSGPYGLESYFNMLIEYEGLEIKAGWASAKHWMSCSHLSVECHGEIIACWRHSMFAAHQEVFDEFCRKFMDRRRRFEKAHPTESELAAARQELKRIIGR
jgi:hypothetical protein